MIKAGRVGIGKTKDPNFAKIMQKIANLVTKKIGEGAVEAFTENATQHVQSTLVTGRSAEHMQTAFKSFPTINALGGKQSLVIGRLPAYFELLERGRDAKEYKKQNYPKTVKVSEEPGLDEWAKARFNKVPEYLTIGGDNTGFGKSRNKWFTFGVSGMKTDTRTKAIERLRNIKTI